MQIKGAEAIMESLLHEKVDTMFGYPGGSIMITYDALYDYQDRIHHILTRHEQGAIHAAQGYARATGKVGVCLATSGPGATNLITGLADAMIDSTPVVCITGQVASHLLGTDAFQETDVVGISMPVTKWNIQVKRAEDVADALSKAFYIAASGRPGPVVVDITKDAQAGMTDFDYKITTKVRSYVAETLIDKQSLIDAAELINSAKKPMILFGQGVILGGAEAEFKAFVEKSGIPAAWTLLGTDALPSDHPLNVGMLGMHGNLGPNLKTNECDVLIAVGMRFDDRVTGDLSRYAKQAKVIHMEIDPAEIDKNVKADVAVLGNVKKSLRLLSVLLEKRTYDAWLGEFKACFQKEYDYVIKDAITPTSGEITMGEAVKIANEVAGRDSILVTDVGQHQMIANRYYKHSESRTSITSGGLGTMGFGLPAALGAQMGCPEKTVVLAVGDGGLQMTIQELTTLAQENAKVKILLLNNNYLGMVRQWQQLFFEHRYSSTPMFNPDFVKVAEGCRIAAKQVSKREDLQQSIEQMINYDGAFLLEVKVKMEENVFPMVPAGASVSEVLLSEDYKPC
ncbi:MAG: biosynthetic-type acetolactate synthase large subunit [Bacteroidales bacterium]|jgi:acetolactate synthase-1/2/3 large subunit|nr:biosynthetic-type acetolactate synthase large subunit [Bacteroidales bacterium]